MSMTLMMKAIAKAHIRLLRTQVCLTCCVGLEPKDKNKWEIDEKEEKNVPKGPLNQVLFTAWERSDHFRMKELITNPHNYMNTIIREEHCQEDLFSHLYAVQLHLDWNVDWNFGTTNKMDWHLTGMLKDAHRKTPVFNGRVKCVRRIIWCRNQHQLKTNKMFE